MVAKNLTCHCMHEQCKYGLNHRGLLNYHPVFACSHTVRGSNTRWWEESWNKAIAEI